MSVLGMDPAELRELVTLQAPTVVADGQGGQTESWAHVDEIPDVWARVRPLTTKERIEAARTSAPADFEVTIRYRTDALATQRVLWGTRELNVVGRPANLDMRQEYLTMPCMEREP